MATTVYGNTINGYWRVFLTYTFNGTSSATHASLSWSYGVNWVKQIKGNNDNDGNYQTEKDRPTYVSCTGQTTQYRYPTARLTKTWYTNGNRSYTYGSGTFYIPRTKAAQSITIKASSYHNSSSTTYKGTSAKSVTFTVPARTAYTISYDANGGSGAPSNQTKYHGYDITLSTTTPSKTNWGFSSWKSSSTSKTYAAGANFSENANVTLTAQWTYVKPTMTSFELQRVDMLGANNFSENDEGQYLRVKFNYTSGHVPSAAASGTTTTVTAKLDGSTVNVYSGSGTTFNSSFTFSGTGTVTKYYNLGTSATDQAHTLVFTLNEFNGEHITTISVTVSSSLYPLELSPDGLLLSTGSDFRLKKDAYILVDDVGGTDSLYVALTNIGWNNISSIITNA